MGLEFDTLEDERIFVTRFIGSVGDEELVDCYRRLVAVGRMEDSRPHLVDGRQVTEITVTRSGMERLAGDFASHDGGLRGHRVALLADRDLVYGMFRVWQAERSELGDEALVFRDEAKAVAWLLGGLPPLD